jgi:hypothetical protein
VTALLYCLSACRSNHLHAGPSTCMPSCVIICFVPPTNSLHICLSCFCACIIAYLLAVPPNYLHAILCYYLLPAPPNSLHICLSRRPVCLMCLLECRFACRPVFLPPCLSVILLLAAILPVSPSYLPVSLFTFCLLSSCLSFSYSYNPASLTYLSFPPV